ncbi:hypothetical protein LQ327_24070 [Actinomycetospora endophytica]|uniref:Secreted protein n=1 Tax=Actinomycetospora endophytica TaxID=2291215 RepID=A0ABS8PDW0_9PSEU|nr:hypothetical protein [Actinomycetospora endophytica]
MVALLGAGLAEAPDARAAAAPGDTWIAELSVAGGDDTNVVATDGAVRLAGTTTRAQSARSPLAEGELLLPPRRLPTPVDRVSADVTADVPPGAVVSVDVRGLRADGTWSGWASASPGGPAMLPQASSEVQVRASLVASPSGAGPALHRIYLTADRTKAATAPSATIPIVPGAPAPAPLATPAVSSKVFATREGLVGGTTANGHVIAPNDHFVALPSRRGLSPRDTGDYTVKVCAATGRCAWAPVWDVGPWNTTDDYWNPAAARQTWKDLPQGTPQAQAAFQQRYNGGKDGFGRAVVNPAGIDLADGTFYNDLGLRDNGWVTVTYLWTGTGPTALAKPTGTPTVAVRSAPTDASSAVGAVAGGARVAVQCTAAGQLRSGAQGTSSSWLRIGPNQYVPAAGVEAPRVASC